MIQIWECRDIIWFQYPMKISSSDPMKISSSDFVKLISSSQSLGDTCNLPKYQSTILKGKMPKNMGNLKN